MACVLTSGRLLNCTDKVGGAKRIYFANYSPLTAAWTETAKEITGTPTLTVYRYDLENGTGGATETITKSVENGTRYYEIGGDFILSGIDKAMQAELDLLTAGRLFVFVEDYNGNILFYGKENGCHVVGGSAATGTANGDLNGYTLTIMGKERYSAPLLEAFTDYPFDNLTDVTVNPAFA